MAYLNLWRDEYDELDGVTEATEKHQDRIDTDTISEFISEAKNITSVSDSTSTSFEVVAGHPNSNGAPRMTIRLSASVEQDDGIVNIYSTLPDLPGDVAQAEAIVRALKSELQEHGCSQFEISGRPGRNGNVSARLFS